MKKIKLVTSAELLKWQGDMNDGDAANVLGISREHYNRLKKGKAIISENITLRFLMLARAK